MPYVSLIGFDADEAEVRRLEHEFAHQEHMRFVPRALGSKPGRSTFYRTREPGGSSLFRPDVAHVSHLPVWDGGEIDGTVEVEISTLDSWAAETRVDRVDSLKLDTQGSELDILRGGRSCLEGVRHIEVEVAFNEISDGAPLFGEVDAFLRKQGFALWRLRDLVCHALEGARDPPRAKEFFWYQSSAQEVSMPGGQLIWCNAHYVKRDMYEPGQQLDWEARLRDACLVEVLGFHDLAILSLNRLLEGGCPSEVHSAAESFLASAATPSAIPDEAAAAALRSTVERLGAVRRRARRVASLVPRARAAQRRDG